MRGKKAIHHLRITQNSSARFLSVIFALSLVTTSSGWAADASHSAKANIYDESLDGARQVTDALATAKKENKRVLLQFGANWCGWCHKLHRLFESDSAIKETLKADYVVALIDVNKGHNSSLVTNYEAQHFGLPFIVILDADGKRLVSQRTDPLEDGDHHSPQKVLAFLKKWAPPK
jgi:thiol:disulfide interchange protein